MGRKNRLPEFILPSGRRGCVACWKCVEACPKNVFGKVQILWHRHVKVVNPDACVGCGKCVEACPQELFVLNRRAV